MGEDAQEVLGVVATTAEVGTTACDWGDTGGDSICLESVAQHVGLGGEQVGSEAGSPLSADGAGGGGTVGLGLGGSRSKAEAPRSSNASIASM